MIWFENHELWDDNLIIRLKECKLQLTYFNRFSLTPAGVVSRASVICFFRSTSCFLGPFYSDRVVIAIKPVQVAIRESPCLHNWRGGSCEVLVSSEGNTIRE